MHWRVSKTKTQDPRPKTQCTIKKITLYRAIKSDFVGLHALYILSIEIKNRARHYVEEQLFYPATFGRFHTFQSGATQKTIT